MVFAMVLKRPEQEVDEMSSALSARGEETLHKSMTIDDLYSANKIADLRRLKRLAFATPDKDRLQEMREKK